MRENAVCTKEKHRREHSFRASLSSGSRFLNGNVNHPPRTQREWTSLSLLARGGIILEEAADLSGLLSGSLR